METPYKIALDKASIKVGYKNWQDLIDCIGSNSLYALVNTQFGIILENAMKEYASANQQAIELAKQYWKEKCLLAEEAFNLRTTHIANNKSQESLLNYNEALKKNQEFFLLHKSEQDYVRIKMEEK